MKRKYKFMLLFVVVILIVSPFIGYFLAKSSEPFRYTSSQIKNSIQLQEKLGNINKITLEPFGYSIKYRGPKGWAEFEVNLDGTTGTGRLVVKLEKNLGDWEVRGSKLNGKNIKLKNSGVR